MAYKDILVVLDDTAECEERVDVALQLARRHETHLIGLMVIEGLSLPAYAIADLPSSVMEQRRQMEDEGTRAGPAEV